ncbi:MAG: hypothetical protein IMZ43_09720 [Thermoplasmata archaeon]|nr:hypothetical protein [Thermoplasmata archaeon]
MPAGTGVFYLVIPEFLGGDAPTGTFTIPMPSFEGSSGYVTAEFTIPVPIMSGTGITISGVGEFDLPILIATGTGSPGILGQGIFVVPQLQFESVSGPMGSGAFILPQFVLFDIVPGHGIGSFVIPIPVMFGGSQTIPTVTGKSLTHRGVVMNLSNQAISTYSNYPFNSLAKFNGRYLAAGENGIYELSGDSDSGTQILSKIKTGPMDFGEKFIKHLRNAWLTYRSDGHIELVLYVDEDEDNPVSRSTEIASDEIHEERLKVPRGLKGRYYTIELKNMSGSDFDIDKLSLLVESIRKKVR